MEKDGEICRVLKISHMMIFSLQFFSVESVLESGSPWVARMRLGQWGRTVAVCNLTIRVPLHHVAQHPTAALSVAALNWVCTILFRLWFLPWFAVEFLLSYLYH